MSKYLHIHQKYLNHHDPAQMHDSRLNIQIM